MRNMVTLPECESCPVRGCSFFSGLSENELERISDSKGGNLYKRGQLIFYAGTRPSGVHCIYKGKVKIYKLDPNGHEQIVRLAKEGDILGYRSLISNEPYASFAAPLEDSLICFIPKEVFFDLLFSNQKLSLKMMQRLSVELKSAEKRLAEMAQKPVRERVAETLLLLKKFFGTREDGQTLNVAITREDLAHIVGTATETLIRFLSEFRQEELIELKGRRIKILNSPRLTRIANLYD